MTVRRCGFTLVEVMLVLAVLVALTAMAWPMLDGLLAERRLKAAADQLRAEFTQARVTAMNTGTPQQLTFDAATGRYAVLPVDDGTAIDPFTIGGDVGVAQIVPEGRPLPEGITFHAVAAVDDAGPPPATIATPSVMAPAAAPATTQEVYFHPDGTTSSARVTLVNDRAMYLDVRLRGLTGATSVGEVFAAEAAP